jgi:hypothetical protein
MSRRVARANSHWTFPGSSAVISRHGYLSAATPVQNSRPEWRQASSTIPCSYVCPRRSPPGHCARAIAPDAPRRDATPACASAAPAGARPDRSPSDNTSRAAAVRIPPGNYETTLAAQRDTFWPVARNTHRLWQPICRPPRRPLCRPIRSAGCSTRRDLPAAVAWCNQRPERGAGPGPSRALCRPWNSGVEGT